MFHVLLLLNHECANERELCYNNIDHLPEWRFSSSLDTLFNRVILSLFSLVNISICRIKIAWIFSISESQLFDYIRLEHRGILNWYSLRFIMCGYNGVLTVMASAMLLYLLTHRYCMDIIHTYIRCLLDSILSLFKVALDIVHSWWIVITFFTDANYNIIILVYCVSNFVQLHQALVLQLHQHVSHLNLLARPVVGSQAPSQRSASYIGRDGWAYSSARITTPGARLSSGSKQSAVNRYYYIITWHWILGPGWTTIKTSAHCGDADTGGDSPPAITASSTYYYGGFNEWKSRDENINNLTQSSLHYIWANFERSKPCPPSHSKTHQHIE